MVVAGYAAFIGIVFVLIPPNPDEITAPHGFGKRV